MWDAKLDYSNLQSSQKQASAQSLSGREQFIAVTQLLSRGLMGAGATELM